jgi:hypothetical protein
MRFFDRNDARAEDVPKPAVSREMLAMACVVGALMVLLVALLFHCLG